jgi:hypothetical protein
MTMTFFCMRRLRTNQITSDCIATALETAFEMNRHESYHFLEGNDTITIFLEVSIDLTRIIEQHHYHLPESWLEQTVAQRIIPYRIASTLDEHP